MQPTKHLHSKGGYLTSRLKGDIKDPEIFHGKQVYLDIKSSRCNALFEDVLKRVGAIVHLFLVDEVNVIVTDRKEWVAGRSCINNIASCPVVSKSTCAVQLFPKVPSALPSWEAKEESLIKSRVGEMLNRAKNQSIEETVDPLDIALQKGITILSLTEAQEVVNKLLQLPEVKKLKSPFVKLDFIQGNHLPIVKEFSVGWPTFKISGSGDPFNNSPNLKLKNKFNEKPDQKLRETKKRINKLECSKYNKASLSFPTNIVSISDEHKIKNASNKRTVSSIKAQNRFNGPTGNCSDVKLLDSVAELHAQVTTNTKSLGKSFGQKTNVSEESLLKLIEPYLFSCLATVSFSKHVAYATLLSMSIQPCRKGNLFVFFPKLCDIKETGEIHVVENECVPTFPPELVLTQKTKFNVLPISESEICPQAVFAVTGGTYVFLENDAILKEDTKNSHLMQLLNFHQSYSRKIENYVNSNNSMHSPNSECMSTVRCVSVTINCGNDACVDNNKVVLKFSLPDCNSGKVSCELSVTTGCVKRINQNGFIIVCPLIDIGLLEVVLCSLVQSVCLENIEEWFNEKDSRTQLSTRKPKCVNFDLILPAPSEVDHSLFKLLIQAVSDLDQRKLIYEGCEYCVNFDLKYVVKIFQKYQENRNSPTTGAFKRLSPSALEYVKARIETVSRGDFPTIINFAVNCEETDKKLEKNKVELESQKVASLSENINICIDDREVEVCETNNDYNIETAIKTCNRNNSMRKCQEVSNIPQSCIYQNVSFGFCQICGCDYESLAKHLKEESHIRFVENAANFTDLDQSILEVNGSSLFGRNQGMLYGDSRRSLRSDKTTCDLGSQMTSSPNCWKNLLTSKKTSLPPFSNGHHLRSTSSIDNTPTSFEETDLEAQCNGVTPTQRCYGTRYAAKISENNGVKIASSRKSDQWGECFDEKLSQNQALPSSAFNSLESGQLSPVVSNSGHKLRSRHVWFSNNISLGATNLEFDDQINSRHDSIISSQKNFHRCEEDTINIDDVSEITNKGRKGYTNPESKYLHKQAMKRKRLTAEEKLLEDNKAYYKLEVKNSKLRSSGYYLSQTDPNICISEETSVSENIPVQNAVCNGKQYESVTTKEISEKVTPSAEVKRNKIRLSELSLLNNEAENFMFGEPSQSYEGSEEDNSDYTKSCESDECDLNSHNGTIPVTFSCEKELKVVKDKNIKTFNGNTLNVSNKLYCCSQACDVNVHSSGSFRCDEPCKLCNCCCTESYNNGMDGVQKRPKRRINSEVFYNDESDVYKNEELSRDSIHSDDYSLPSLNMPNKLENDVWTESEDWMKSNGETVVLKRENNVNLNSSCSECDSLELKTNNISKVGNNLARQDLNMKLVDKSSDVKSEALTGLHFSFEGIPENEPWYQTYQRQDEGEEYYLSGVKDCIYWKSFLLPYEMPLDKLNLTVNTIPKSTNSGSVKRRKRKANANLLDKKPRKSPRCHASTLAILSSLMHHRKRKESDKTREEVFKTSCYSNETTDSSVDKTNSTESSIDIKDFAQNIDQLFDLCTDVGSQSDSPVQICEDMNCVKSVKSKSLKCKRSHKCVTAVGTKISESDNFCIKDCESIDVDPVVLEQLANSGENPLNCIDELSVRNRGGPCMDVITLLNGYVNCCCVDEVKNKDIPHENGFQPSSFRESYNSSECASSTCETIQYSDVGENLRVRGKKRKRKKNLTGWPVEKQKLKRRLMLKLARPAVDLNLKNKDEGEQVLETGSLNELKEENCDDNEGYKLRQVNNVHVNNSENQGSVNPRPESAISEACVEVPSRSTNSEHGDSDRFDSIDKNCDMEYAINNCVNLTPSNTTEKFCSSRTVSIDSNSQHCDFQPRVRVKKINNVSNLNFVIKTSAGVSSINNSRKLRSTSSYLSSASLRKKQFYECGEKMEVARRASARMKKSCSRWDSWSTRRRR